MSQLAARAELVKLRAQLGLPGDALAALQQLPEAQLRRLRDAVSELTFRQELPLFRRLGRIAAQLPAVVAAPLARALGPLLAARIVTEMPAVRALAIAQRMSPQFMASVCSRVDPRRARELIAMIPVDQVVAIALELLRSGDHATMGRFVGFLEDAAIRAVIDAVPDEGDLLRIAYYLDSRNRLDHVVRLLSRERRRAAMLLALDPARDLLDQILSLVIGVDHALKRELGDLAAEQGEAVLSRIVGRVHERAMWGDLLPVVASLSVASRTLVVNLPQLREDPAVLAGVLCAADRDGMWRIALELLPLLDEAQREAFASAGAALPRAAIGRAVQATLVGELWQPAIDLVRRMPLAKQVEFAQVLKELAGVDPELDARVLAMAREQGMQPALTAAGF